VRDRIAKYLAVVRPVLEKSLVEKGNTLVPTGTTGIASVLSWTRTPSTTEWSPREQSVVRSLGRVAALWSSSRDELARSLGIEVDGYFLGGRGEREAKTPLPRDAKSKPKQLRLLDELTKLVRIAEQRRFYVEGSVERTLRCFKLGAEVAAEDVIPTWRKRKELYFQRQLIKFFVERGLTAFGTKFGRSEIDMRAHDSFGALVVETKILKGALSVRSLNRWLTQLGSYMDIEHVALRGALVIFNFGNSPIFAPATAIRFRYFVVVINLCAESPSKRSASIEIEEARDATDVVRLVPLGSDPPERVRRRPAARSRKTK